MELKINLIGKKRKEFSELGFVIYCFLFASSWLISRFIKNEIIESSDWILFGILSLFGAVGLSIYLLENFYGKAYILIDSEVISLKSSVYNKKQLANWNEIKSVNYNMINCEFKIEKTDNTSQIISISKFDFALMVEIKKAVSSIAKEKNIQSNI